MDRLKELKERAASIRKRADRSLYIDRKALRDIDDVIRIVECLIEHMRNGKC